MTQAQMPDLPQAEIERVRGYLIAQAAKLRLADLVEKVRKDSQPLREVARSVPPERFRERPGPEDWSAAEVYTHILDMTERGAGSIEGIIDTGALPPPIDDTLRHEQREGLRGAEDYWRAFDARRERLFERVSRASGDEHLDVSITHPIFGPLNWREWLLFMRVHDLDHLRQIQSVADGMRGA